MTFIFLLYLFFSPWLRVYYGLIFNLKLGLPIYFFRLPLQFFFPILLFFLPPHFTSTNDTSFWVKRNIQYPKPPSNYYGKKCTPAQCSLMSCVLAAGWTITKIHFPFLPRSVLKISIFHTI